MLIFLETQKYIDYDKESDCKTRLWLAKGRMAPQTVDDCSIYRCTKIQKDHHFGIGVWLARRRRGWVIADGLTDREPWWANVFLLALLLLMLLTPVDGVPGPASGESEARRTERVKGRREGDGRECLPAASPSVMGSRGMTGQDSPDGPVDRFDLIVFSLTFLFVFMSQ